MVLAWEGTLEPESQTFIIFRGLYQMMTSPAREVSPRGRNRKERRKRKLRLFLTATSDMTNDGRGRRTGWANKSQQFPHFLLESAIEEKKLFTNSISIAGAAEETKRLFSSP